MIQKKTINNGIDKPANKVLHVNNRLHPIDEIVAAMYAMYTTKDPDTGKLRSIEHVAKVYRKGRQEVYCLLKERGYILRSKKLLGLQIYKDITFTLHKNGSLRGTINKKRVYMHHFVWLDHYGEIPKDHYICHKDGNKTNNAIDNLYTKLRRNT